MDTMSGIIPYQSKYGATKRYADWLAMEEKIYKHPYSACWLIFVICAAARIIEYFLFRTDETIIAENFLHKLFGIGILITLIKILDLKPKDIGFVKTDISSIGKGILLGIGCFAVAYLLEMSILLFQGKEPYLDFYATGFSLNGGEIIRNDLVFILLCVFFNVINVIMEEGIFRGLYLKLIEPVSGFAKANLYTAFLFGIWHWVMPMRNFTDGDLSFAGLIAIGIGYVIFAGVMSIKWGLLYKMTGSLWIGLGDHLFNNVATNLIHVTAEGEADSMQIVRIIVAQLMSMIIVVLLYKKHKKLNSYHLEQ